MIEAYEDHRPLVAVSADRPEELHGCGANQTIDQQGTLRLARPGRTPAARARHRDGRPDACAGNWTGARPPARGRRGSGAHQRTLSASHCTGRRSSRTSDPGCRTDPTMTGGGTPPIQAHSPCPRSAARCCWWPGNWRRTRPMPCWPWPDASGCPSRRTSAASCAWYAIPWCWTASTGCWPAHGDGTALGAVNEVLQFGGHLTGKRLNQWLSGFPGKRWLVSRHSALPGSGPQGGRHPGGHPRILRAVDPAPAAGPRAAALPRGS
jgi:2-succinyl-5-enolpyruvyl-6-hydroxy-3-cyclohexene-1-carboxylate synthase